MELRAGWIPGWLELIPGLDPADRAARAERAVERLARGELDPADLRVALADGRVRSVVRLLPRAGADEVPLELLGPPDSGLLNEALVRARARGAGRVTARRPDPGWDAALSGAGFARGAERVELGAPIDRLPDDAGTPLRWTSLPRVELALVHDLIARTAEGALDPPAGTPPEVLADWLADPVLGGRPECVEAGALGGDPVALVCAQVNPRSGFGTCTWLGLVPAARGRGLGRWVHRRGLASLRRQGATHYRGGTTIANAPMRALFRAAGCEELGRVVEWTRRLGAGPG